jgi:hypothetical protein
VQREHVDAIAGLWADPDLPAFLAESVPDVDAWSLRRLGSAGLEPQLLAVTDRHLYRITAGVEDGRRAFSFERLPLRGMAVALLEFRDDARVRRRWKLRTRDEAFTVETEQAVGDAPPALERVMRLVLEHAD